LSAYYTMSVNLADDVVVEGIVKEENHKSMSKTQASLIRYVQAKGISAVDLGTVLKAAGFSGFEVQKWDEMIKAVDWAAL
jgi:hypothetical protein